MKKYIKIVIVIVMFIIIVSIINKVLGPDMNTQITNDLIKKGFTVSEDESLLVKQEDSEKQLKFSLGDYTLMKNVDESNNGVDYSLNATYYFNQDNIIYSYRIAYNNSYNTYFKGEYSNGNFTCEKEFSNASLSNTEKENICNLAKANLDIFYLESKTLFSNNKIIKYIKQK